MAEDLNVGGVLLGIIGDMNLSMYKQFPVVYANQNMLNNHGVSPETMYSTVLDGEWTFEQLFEWSSGLEQDLNGDGEIKAADDTIGLGIQITPFWAVQAAFNLPNIDLDEDGIPYVVGLNEKYVTAAQFLASNIHSEPSIAVSIVNGTNTDMTPGFVGNRSGFVINTMNEVERMRDMDNDFAILPFPKLEAIDDYRTLIATATNMNYVPSTVSDPELVGKILEAMAYYSYMNVVPAYYETALKERYSRDESTKQMLDIIRDSAVLPFEFAYSTALAPSSSDWPHKILAEAVIYNTVDSLSSSIASKEKIWSNMINKLMENYADNS